MDHAPVERAKHATLTGTEVDSVALETSADYVEVLNRVGEAPLWVTKNGDDPEAGADDVSIVPAGTSKVFALGKSITDHVIKVLGDGNEYSVEVVEE